MTPAESDEGGIWGHGIKSVAYWTPVEEPQKSNTLVYILQHPSRDEAAANWKSLQDDPEVEECPRQIRSERQTDRKN